MQRFPPPPRLVHVEIVPTIVARVSAGSPPPGFSFSAAQGWAVDDHLANPAACKSFSTRDRKGEPRASSSAIAGWRGAEQARRVSSFASRQISTHCARKVRRATSR